MQFLLFPFLLYMQNMQQAVDNGCKENRRNAQKGHAAVQGIEGGKELGLRCGHLCYGSHARQDHAGHVKTIEPRQITKPPVTHRADGNRYQDEQQSKQAISSQAQEKPREGDYFILFMFQFQNMKCCRFRNQPFKVRFYGICMYLRSFLCQIYFSLSIASMAGRSLMYCSGSHVMSQFFR